MNIVAAVNNDLGIGFNGTQTIIIPQDRTFFKNLTQNGTVVMGRKTFDDIGMALPNRKNIVLTGNINFHAPSVKTAHSMSELSTMLSREILETVFVIGGAAVYELLLPFCKHAYITKISATEQSDVFFPNLDELDCWRVKEVLHDDTDVYRDKNRLETPVRYKTILYENTKQLSLRNSILTGTGV